jgi:hypothetical protein
VTSPGGYAVPVDASAVDAIRFEELVAEATRLRDVDPPAALELYEEALGLWRGPAYTELAFEDFIQSLDHAVGGDETFRNRGSDRS